MLLPAQYERMRSAVVQTAYAFSPPQSAQGMPGGQAAPPGPQGGAGEQRAPPPAEGGTDDELLAALRGFTQRLASLKHDHQYVTSLLVTQA